MTKHMKAYGILLIVLLVGSVAYYGCDVGINPLLFDGSPLEATFTIDQVETSYSDSKEVDLNSAIKDISKSIDSIKVFNVTVRAENTGSTNPSTTFSGNGTFEGNTLVTLTNVSMTTLATERSIFNTTGISFNSAGVAALTNAIKDAVEHSDTPHPRTFSVTITASNSPIQIKLYVKVYTQVFTTP